MTIPKDERERAVFELFAKAEAHFTAASTIESRPEPEADILLSLPSGERRAFELVEILDQGYASSLQCQLNTREACYKHLESMEGNAKKDFKDRFADADIFLAFRGNLTFQRRKRALSKIFQYLLSLPPGAVGNFSIENGTLEKVLEYITIQRGDFEGPMFDASSYVRMGDPTVEAIRSKLGKAYKSTHELNLLAYIETNPMFPDDVWLSGLDKYLATLDMSCQFANIYVYDCRVGTIKRSWRRDS